MWGLGLVGFGADPGQIVGQAVAHWDSDNFRQLVGVMVADGRLQRRVGRCRGLYQQRHFVGFLDCSLPAIH